MKQYRGFGGGAVYVTDGKKKKLAVNLPPDASGFYWGGGGPGAIALAYSILFDALDDSPRAHRLKTRFADRVIKALPKGEGWALSMDEITSVVQDIEKIDREYMPYRQRVAREPAQRFESDRGSGVVWDNERNE